jgi:hypothetical protein
MESASIFQASNYNSEYIIVIYFPSMHFINNGITPHERIKEITSNALIGHMILLEKNVCHKKPPTFFKENGVTDVSSANQLKFYML